MEPRVDKNVLPPPSDDGSDTPLSVITRARNRADTVAILSSGHPVPTQASNLPANPFGLRAGDDGSDVPTESDEVWSETDLIEEQTIKYASIAAAHDAEGTVLWTNYFESYSQVSKTTLLPLCHLMLMTLSLRVTSA